ncbi:MAG: outer membrane beta-barrel protein [Lactobacillales bacterium]|nr:outer membrane beta-barrel protein [Lactobacillales bacterium]
MKKYLLSGLAIAGLMMFAGAASAGNPYTVVEAGYSIGAGDAGDAGIIGIGGGYVFNEFLRSDIIVSYRKFGDLEFSNTSPDIWSIPVLANVYGTYPIGHGFGVYGMAGLGMSFNKTDSDTGVGGKTKSNFAWNVGAGVDYKINRCWTVDLGYRYSDLGEGRVKADAGYTGKTKEDLRSHDIKLGLRYNF